MTELYYYRTEFGTIGSDFWKGNEELLMVNYQHVVEIGGTILDIIKATDLVIDGDGYCVCITKVIPKKNYIEINGCKKMNAKEFIDYCENKEIITNNMLRFLGQKLIKRSLDDKLENK